MTLKHTLRGLEAYWIDQHDSGGSFDLHPGELRYVVVERYRIDEPSLDTIVQALAEAFGGIAVPGFGWRIEVEGGRGRSITEVTTLNRLLTHTEWSRIDIRALDTTASVPDLRFERKSWVGRKAIGCFVGHVDAGTLGALDGTVEVSVERSARLPVELIAELTA